MVQIGARDSLRSTTVHPLGLSTGYSISEQNQDSVEGRRAGQPVVQTTSSVALQYISPYKRHFLNWPHF